MLAQRIAERHPGRVRFVEENFGDSPLAERFGVEHYPAIFVDDALVAGPWDFFEWPGTPAGRYVPFRDPASRERFERDLEDFVSRRLAGEGLESTSDVPAAGAFQVATLPSFETTTLAGEPIDSEALGGRVVLVELWATWCPPCQSTLAFLGGLEREYGERLAVLPIAVSSEESAVRELLAETPSAPGKPVMGNDDLVERLGGVLAVPTLILFDRQGATVEVYYGAPPDLHERVSRKLGELLP